MNNPVSNNTETPMNPSTNILKGLLKQELKEFSDTLLFYSPYPILILASDTSIAFVNPAFENITGYSGEELIGRKAPYVWWAEKSTAERIRRLKTSMNKGKHKFERLFKRKDGELFWVEITSRSVKANNSTKYYFSIWVDITERKETQDELTELNNELHNLSGYLEVAKENERAKISRKIHDELGQMLTAIQLQVDLLSNKLTEDQKDLMTRTQTITKMIDSAIVSVHSICSELTPKLLDDMGIEAAIKCLVTEYFAPTDIDFKLSCTLYNRLNRNFAISIYRIIQHSITNIARHAHASKVWIDINQIPDANYIYVTIEDNGKGITKAQIANPESYGIRVMRERVNYWDGSINIVGVKNKGTKISIKIPLSEAVIV